MPLYARCVSPVNLSNAPLGDVSDHESEAIANRTLANLLRQLASLVLHAEDVFHDLHKDFETVYRRAGALHTRVKQVQEKASRLNAKAVIVPESDLTAFSERTEHYATDYGQERLLFTTDSRPAAIERLYQEAVQNPLLVLRQLDLFRSDGLRCSKFFTCTPVVQRDRLPLDIETRRPEAVDQLPDWTADEAELTSPVHPDLRFHPLGQAVSEGALYQLPQPERVTEARAQRFTTEVVPVDVTGAGFQRLVKFRQSLIHFDYVKRRRKRRDKNRRNTIGDTREIEDVVRRDDLPSTSGISTGRSKTAAAAGAVGAGSGSDQQTQTEADTELSTAEDEQEPSFTRLTIRADIERAMTEGSASVSPSVRLPQLGAANTFDPPVREPVYELIRSTRARLPLPVGPAAAVRRRAALSEASSSGHGSGGSNRTSADSERVVSPADSGTVTSPAEEAPAEAPDDGASASPRRHIASPVDSGLSDGGRLEEVSFASDDTVTPDFPDADADAEDGDADGDTSSAFSCDTEGYYTSFHCDSGLRTAPENEYDLVGRGSTGTGTASNTSGSDSTVVLRRKPPPPPRASSLDGSHRESLAANRESVVTVINMDAVSQSTDEEKIAAEATSADERKTPTAATATTAATSAAAKAATAAAAAVDVSSDARQSSCSPIESDLDLPERQQDFRSKTAMTSGRIPSLCVITPPLPSDGDDTSMEWPPPPASPVPALQVVTGRGPGGATVLMQPPPPPLAPASNESARRGPPRGRSLSPRSSQTAPRPAPRPPPPGTGSLDRAAAGRRRSPLHISPPPSPLPSPPPDPRRREAHAAAAQRAGQPGVGAAERQQQIQQRQQQQREQQLLQQQEQQELRQQQQQQEQLQKQQQQQLWHQQQQQLQQERQQLLHQQQQKQQEQQQLLHLQQQQQQRQLQQKQQQQQPQQQQQWQRRDTSPAGSSVPMRQAAEARPEAQLPRPGSDATDGGSAVGRRLSEQQRLLPPNLRSPTLIGQPVYQTPRPASADGHWHRQQQQYQLHQRQQQQQAEASRRPLAGAAAQEPPRLRRSLSPPPAHSTPQPGSSGVRRGPALDESTTDSSHSGDAPTDTSATRARKPTPATGAIATPPTIQVQAAQSRARRNSPSTAAAAGADGKTKSRLPRAFSPFSFGRASLRAKSPATDKEKENEKELRRPADPSGSEADDEPRTDEQKLKRLKKKWLWTLPLRKREKKKKKSEAGDDSDDDGGFRAGNGSSFVRYESPDSVSSGVSSRASTPLTDASLSSSYYEMEQYFPALNTSQMSASGLSSMSAQSGDSSAAGRQTGEAAGQLTAPRPPNFSSSFLEYSPPDTGAAGGPVPPMQSAAYATPPARVNMVAKPPRVAVGVAPRAGTEGLQQQRGPATDAIYGTRTVFARPRALSSGASPARAPAPPSVVRTGPAAAVAARSRRSWSGPAGTMPGAGGQRASWAGRASAPAPLAPLTRPTPLTEFKQLIARQGSPAGGAPGRLSAADRLRPAGASPGAAAAPSRSPAGVPQSPLDARNSARAVLFQNRFGGRRCRTPRTNVIATTIPESEEEALAPARRQLFSGESGSSGSSPETPLRMSPSSPPPPYSADGFQPVGDTRPRRSGSLHEGEVLQRPTPLATSTPSGERHKFQCGSLPRGPLAATFSYRLGGDRGERTALQGSGRSPPTVTRADSSTAGDAERPGSAGRVETAL